MKNQIFTTPWGRFKTQVGCTNCETCVSELLAGKQVFVHPTMKGSAITDFATYPGVKWPYLILSAKAAEIFREHRLPDYKETEFLIRQGGAIHKYLCWSFERIELDSELIDFEQSRFFVQNSKGVRRYEEIDSSADLDILREAIGKENASRVSILDREYLDAERIVYFPSATPNLDFFSPPFDLDFYIRKSLGEKLERASLTGYELRPRARIYIE